MIGSGQHQSLVVARMNGPRSVSESTIPGGRRARGAKFARSKQLTAAAGMPPGFFPFTALTAALTAKATLTGAAKSVTTSIGSSRPRSRSRAIRVTAAAITGTPNQAT